MISWVPNMKILVWNENETITDMITKFTKITNGLTSLGDEIDNDQKMRKVICAFPPSWEVKSTTLKELNDKKKIELIGLIGNLKTHKIKKKLEKKDTPKEEDSCLQIYSHYLRRRRRWWRFIPSRKDCEENVQQGQVQQP